MPKTLNLRQYVKRRTGIPLGGRGSLRQMLVRSLGANSFAGFWRYWNPIWSYYLSRYVMKPCNRLLPSSIATVVTFVISGAIHDIAVILVKWKITYFFTPWFFYMGVAVVVLNKLNLSYQKLPWLLRASLNVGTLGLCFWLTTTTSKLFSG